jgi:hypothetical protein
MRRELLSKAHLGGKMAETPTSRTFSARHIAAVPSRVTSPFPSQNIFVVIPCLTLYLTFGVKNGRQPQDTENAASGASDLVTQRRPFLRQDISNWNRNIECRAPVRVILRPQLPAVRFDDGAADR